MNSLSTVIVGCSTLLLSACATQIDQYHNTEPNFSLQQFFSGNLEATGIFFDYGGKVTRRFKVTMQGSWQGDEGKLEEWFVYDNGEKQTRVWHLKKTAEGTYEGRADDIDGIAEGKSAGFALNWRYKMNLPYKDGTIAVRFDDWMYLVDENRLINTAKVKKWGIQVGEVVLYIEKK